MFKHRKLHRKCLLAVAVKGKVDEAVGVSPLVIVPGDDLVEGVAEGHSSGGIHNGTVGVVDKVLGNHWEIGVSEDSLELAISGLLQGSLDVISRARLLGAESEIHHGNIRGWDTNGHTGELSVEGRKHLSDSLGSSGAGRDQVVHGRTSCAPVLSSLGGSINDHLGGGGGVDGGHETLHNSKVLVQDLGEWGQAVGCAGGVGENGGSGVFGVVDTHDIHGGISRWSGNDDALASSLQVGLGLGNGGENTSGFANSVGSSLSPLDLLGVSLVEELDLDISDNQAAISRGDFARVNSVDRVILELVGSVLRGQEWIVDSDDGGIWKSRKIIS